jgi:capsular polysaccharide biosynthesis protein
MPVDQDRVTDEISLLDIAVVIAENWIMLLVGPIMAGALALAVVSTHSSISYNAQAEVILPEDAAPLLRSEAVISHAQAKAGNEVEQLKRLALNTLRSKRVPDTEIYQLELSSSDAQVAHASLEAVIEALIVSSAPSQEKMIELDREISRTSARLALVERALNSLSEPEPTLDAEDGLNLGLDAVALVSLLDSQQYHYDTLDKLQLQKQSTVTPESVITSVNVSTVEARPSKLIAVAAAIGVGVVLLVFAFIREGLRGAARDPEQSQKLSRIRKAFGFKA